MAMTLNEDTRLAAVVPSYGLAEEIPAVVMETRDVPGTIYLVGRKATYARDPIDRRW
jgi:hypothetical protein